MNNNVFYVSQLKIKLGQTQQDQNFPPTLMKEFEYN